MPTALASYAYLNAKLKARASKLMKEDRVTELIRARSLPEAMVLLRDTRFRSLEELWSRTGDLRACEATLYAEEARIFLELTRWSKGSIAAFFNALTLRFEMDTLKNALRLWFDGAVRGGDTVGKAGYLDRRPLVNDLNLDALLVAADAAGVGAALARTPYAAVVANGLGPALERGNLFALELELDRFYFDAAYAAAGALGTADRIVATRALDMDADAQNADRLYRFKVWHGLGAEEAAAYLIPHGAASGRKRNADSGGAGDSALGKAGAALGQAGESKAGGELLRRVFRDLALSEARRLLAGNPFSVGIPLAYATLRREELRSVMVILNGAYYGLPEERIRDAL